MVTDVKGVGHLLKDTLEPNPTRRKRLEEARARLNTPRYIRRFELLNDEHCAGAPVVVVQVSGMGPEFRFCSKCLLLIEPEVEL